VDSGNKALIILSTLPEINIRTVFMQNSYNIIKILSVGWGVLWVKLTVSRLLEGYGVWVV
jgi:hypothetical protein